jgi:hypothetical protein
MPPVPFWSWKRAGRRAPEKRGLPVPSSLRAASGKAGFFGKGNLQKNSPGFFNPTLPGVFEKATVIMIIKKGGRLPEEFVFLNGDEALI